MNLALMTTSSLLQSGQRRMLGGDKHCVKATREEEKTKLEPEMLQLLRTVTSPSECDVFGTRVSIVEKPTIFVLCADQRSPLMQSTNIPIRVCVPRGGDKEYEQCTSTTVMEAIGTQCRAHNVCFKLDTGAVRIVISQKRLQTSWQCMSRCIHEEACRCET